MKKIIFFLCFLVLIQNIQAENLKHKFMLTAEAGNAYLLGNHSPRFTSFGAQIDYFLNEQVLIGIDFSYVKYYEPVFIVEFERSGPGADDRNRRKLYNLSLSGKVLLEPGRLAPFFKLGIGPYFPQVIYSKDIYRP